MTNKKVEIEIGVNVSGAPQVGALADALHSTAGAAGDVGNKGAAAAGGINAASSATQGYTGTTGKLRDGLESVSSQLSRAREQMLSLVGIGVGVQGLKDVAALADGYKNLQSRIKLVTGEGDSFKNAWEQVNAVALRTSSTLESTGTLFSKMASAGKSAGLSTADAVAQALKLTETVNQAVQLSGASAAASDAAITQLIQGLQSGVLRGDEFNSVMEQAPRLSQALADGLGVTTGELRKMAEAGQLSSDTVIKALKNQSDTVASEFGKLPATVGRAMTNLTTQFTTYIGEADKAGGYTSKLAGAIDMVAGNLSTVATVMIHTGQAVGAMKLLSMAQDWLTASAAITANATATTAATAKTIENTVATTANAAAVRVQALAAKEAAVTHDAFGMAIAKQAPVLTGNALAMTEIGKGLSGAATAAANVAIKFEPAVAQAGLLSKAVGLAGGAFSVLARAAGPLLALDLVLHFKEYGTWIGEFAAKLMGAKDRTEELARADKVAAQIASDSAEQRKRMAQATQDAVDKSFELSKIAKASIAEFDNLTKAGSTAAEAVAKIGKDFDLGSVKGIKDATAVLDKLVADGKLSASEFQKAWGDALKGADLAVFETSARTAFAGTAREAQRLGQVMDASLRESIKRTGLDFDVISGGMGAASRSAINDTEAMIKGLDRLKTMGVDTAQVLAASLGKGINTADSQKAIEAVRSQIEAVRKALGDKVADGLLDQAKQKALELKDALDKATPGVNSVAEAMKNLGVVSDKALKDTAAQSKTAFDEMRNSGTSSVRELSDGFKKYAADAIAANGGVASEAIKTQAAIYGLEVTTDRAGKAIVRSMNDGRDATERFRGAVNDATAATEEQIKALERLREITSKPVSNRDKVDRDNPYGLTSDGLKANKDGSAAGTFGSTLPIDQADKLKRAVETGQSVSMTQAELAAAKKQATDALTFLQEMSKLSAGAVSSKALQDAQALVNATNTAKVTVTDAKVPEKTATTQPAKTYTVNVNLPGSSPTTINTSSDADAQALIALLHRAKLSA